MPDETGSPRNFDGLILGLVVAALTGAAAMFYGSQILGVRVPMACASIFALTAIAAIGTFVTLQTRKYESSRPDAAQSSPEEEPGHGNAGSARTSVATRIERLHALVTGSFRKMSEERGLETSLAVFGLVVVASLAIFAPVMPGVADSRLVALVAGGALVASAAAALITRYLAGIGASELPEARGLAAWWRVTSEISAICAVGLGCVAFDWSAAADAIATAIFLLAAALALDALLPPDRALSATPVFRTDLRTLDYVASRANPIASIFDKLETSFGIDVRSSWALAVLRGAVEPLIAAVLVLAWLSTSLTVVGPNEQGVLEHLGVASAAAPLEPGLHLHWPWPVDRVSNVAVRDVRSLEVGHGGVESPGPENVLWARQHADQEYTLVLGDGHDLVTVDAAVHFRIRDPHAWLYACQNPTDALSAIAYRAVMDSTVDRTLADVLSENVAALSAKLQGDIQHDADQLGLGLDVLGFTFGGIHPPVPVARDYQAVISAQVDRQTAIIDAQAYTYTTIPGAEAAVVTANNAATADGATNLGKAAGEAWAFRTLQSQYLADPAEYRFRSRMEALESALPGRALTILDDRIEKDGGQLWIPE